MYAAAMLHGMNQQHFSEQKLLNVLPYIAGKDEDYYDIDVDDGVGVDWCSIWSR